MLLRRKEMKWAWTYEQGLMYGRWGYWFCFSFKWLHTSSCLKTFQAWLYAERVRQQTKSGTDCDNIPIGYILVWNRLIIFRSDTSLSGTDCDNIPIRYILVLPFYRITYLIILIFKKMETYYVNKTTNKLQSVLFWILQLLVHCYDCTVYRIWHCMSGIQGVCRVSALIDRKKPRNGGRISTYSIR